MGIASEAFQKGDVYIDFPYEEAMFRFERATGKVYRRFYGETAEVEVDHASKLFAEACIAGQQTSAEEYFGPVVVLCKAHLLL